MLCLLLLPAVVSANEKQVLYQECNISNKQFEQPCRKNGQIWKTFYEYCNSNKDVGWEAGCRYPCE